MPKVRHTRHRSGRAYRNAKAIMHATYGFRCHICGHEGAGEADHLGAVSLYPDQPVDPELMRPAHGSNAPCHLCPSVNGKPRCCNQERWHRENGKRAQAYAPRMPW